MLAGCSATEQRDAVAEAVRAIRAVPEPYDAGFPTALERAAAELQALPVESVREAIIRLSRSYEPGPPGSQRYYAAGDVEWQVMTIIRAAFDVPARVDRPTFAAWLAAAYHAEGDEDSLHPDAECDLLYPLAPADDGRLFHAADLRGHIGTPCDPVGDFDFISSRFPHRPLGQRPGVRTEHPDPRRRP